ncbi:MAG TPA: Gfo/Idh/MocA family oxidoreductase [Armatimonadota bacterium]|nr:Gfo/Idh/MocA family oxidoreductase [Armatimonadota bacterium]HQK96268.1 Gfo/Idh/MocA family oxidoreductase [Armatimonadota bacterium]
MGGSDSINRREFLRKSTVAAAGAALLSSTAAASARVVGANDRVHMATIGCGGMGHAHLGALASLRAQGLVDIVSVCDVWDKRVQSAVAATGAKGVRDYRRVLDDPDVDAVSIATPDHWHAPMAIAALDAGKDVYCEKPMTYWKDLSAARAVVDAVARNHRVLQVGTQGMSDSIWEQVGERIKAGAVGQLVHAQASDMRNGPLGVYEPASNDPDAKPGINLNWNMWLGPAPRRPYDHGRFFAFRSFWDYSGGICTDFFPHTLTPLIRTMGLTFPRRASASGGLYQLRDGREVPDIFNLTLEYPGGPSVLLIAAVACSQGIPMLIRGHQAAVTFDGPGATIRPEPAVVGNQPTEEVTRERAGSLEAHFEDFIDCVRTRKKPRSHELLGYYVMTALHMGVRSYLENRVFEFDAQTERVRAV